MEAIAADDRADVRAPHGWRWAVFGKDALALKHGELALTAVNNRIELVPLAAAGPAGGGLGALRFLPGIESNREHSDCFAGAVPSARRIRANRPQSSRPEPL